MFFLFQKSSTVMAPRLNSFAKSLLLKQALQSRTKLYYYSDLFSNLYNLVLFQNVNRSFVNVGRYYNITQLVVDNKYAPDVDIFFGTDDQNRTTTLCHSVEQARQLIELFCVQSLKINCYYIFNENDDYWSLIDCVKGRLFLKHRFISNILRQN
jgi:hypothetical protein